VDGPALTALWVAALNNDADLEVSGSGNGRQTYRMVGDPTEGALIVAAAKAGASPRDLNGAYPRVQKVPFDAARKRMVTVHALHNPHPEDISPFDSDASYQGGHAILVKGAPDLVLELCSAYQGIDDRILPLDEAQRQRIHAANEAMTQDALRVLGMAYRVTDHRPDISDVEGLEKDLVFVSLIGMIDPPRPEVSPALAKGRKAGIRTVMITGDFPNTARAIAESIGLLSPGHQVLTGPELAQMDDAELQRQVPNTDVFARVSPEHKMRIVGPAHDEVVAMTGDG
jgi:Ca2+-transporting ATPase